MLFVAIREIATQVNQFLAPLATLGQVKLADVAKHERPADASGTDEMENQILLTLINIEEENALKNNYPTQQIGASIIAQPPAQFLNLYLLFSANFTQYDESLKHIGYVIRFFQANKRLTINDAETGLRYDILFAMHHVGFENLNNLWTVLGGKYLPSVLYKARLVMVQEAPPTGSQVITDIQSTDRLN